jgi:hypothetical protein
MANWFERQVAAFKCQIQKGSNARYKLAMMRDYDKVLEKESSKDPSLTEDERKYDRLQIQKKYWTAQDKNGKSKQDIIDSGFEKWADLDIKAGNPANTRLGIFFGKLFSGASRSQLYDSVFKFNDDYGWRVQDQFRFDRAEQKLSENAITKMDEKNKENEKNEKFVGKIDVSDKFENKQQLPQRNSLQSGSQEPAKKRESMGLQQ